MTKQNLNAGDGYKNCFMHVICSMFKKKNSSRKVQIDEREIKVNLAAGANEQFDKKTKTTTVLKYSKKHCKCRQCAKKRQRDRCNSETSPLLRYFRLWCPCFCCCKTKNKTPICCEHCPYKVKQVEQPRVKRCSEECHGQKRVEQEKTKKKKSKSNSPESNTKNTILQKTTAENTFTPTPQQPPPSPHEVRNDAKCCKTNDDCEQNDKSIANKSTCCCHRKPEIYVKQIKCKCAKRMINLEFHRPDDILKPQIKNGIQFIRKYR